MALGRVLSECPKRIVGIFFFQIVACLSSFPGIFKSCF